MRDVQQHVAVLRCARLALLVVLVAAGSACASAGDDGGVGDERADARPGFPDANPQVPPADAASTPDGPVLVGNIDASPPPPDAAPPDAEPGFFCTFNEQCPESQCCLALDGPGVCVDGIRVETFCFPVAAALE